MYCSPLPANPFRLDRRMAPISPPPCPAPQGLDGGIVQRSCSRKPSDITTSTSVMVGPRRHPYARGRGGREHGFACLRSALEARANYQLTATAGQPTAVGGQPTALIGGGGFEKSKEPNDDLALACPVVHFSFGWD